MTALADAWSALWSGVSGLVWPALIFAVIALIARGFAALRTTRAAAGEVRTNMILFALDVVFVTPLLALVLGFSGALLQQSGLALAPSIWSATPAWLIAFIALFAGDFVGYWRHRLEHTPALWPMHAIHHSDTAMTWTTLFRFHPLNRLTTALIDTSALALLGLPAWALAANLMVRHYYGMFIHMDLPWTYGPLGRVLVSPAMHRWHHARDADGAGANFATVFSVFDQAFRTYHVPGTCTVPLGVRDNIGRGALAQLLWPLNVLVRYLARLSGAAPDLIRGRTRNPGATSAAFCDPSGSPGLSPGSARAE
jgi:sterol desaturase/sphingolipid hydroxylase (fatty acid hydroxylase superfamily)